MGEVELGGWAQRPCEGGRQGLQGDGRGHREREDSRMTSFSPEHAEAGNNREEIS